MWRDIRPGGRVSASDLNNLADYAEQIVTGDVSVTRSAAGTHLALPDAGRVLIRITGAADAGAYPWEEVYRDAEDGVTAIEDGRTGTTEDIPAYEWSGSEDVPEGTVCDATIDGSGEFLVFEAPASSVTATITVEAVDGTPSYTGIHTLKVDEADGFVLTNPATGVARLDLTPTLVIEEVDGTPSYTAIGKISFGQADGFVVTNPTAGTARVDLQSATPSQAGIVSTGAQTFGGRKRFKETDIIVDYNPSDTPGSSVGAVSFDATDDNLYIGGGHDGGYGKIAIRAAPNQAITEDVEVLFQMTTQATGPGSSLHPVARYIFGGRSVASGSFVQPQIYIQTSDAPAYAEGVTDTVSGLQFNSGLLTGGALAVSGSSLTGTITFGGGGVSIAGTVDFGTW